MIRTKLRSIGNICVNKSSVIKLGMFVNAVVTTFSWPRQDHCDFKVNSGYIGRPCLYLKINNKLTTIFLLCIHQYLIAGLILVSQWEESVNSETPTQTVRLEQARIDSDFGFVIKSVIFFQIFSLCQCQRFPLE